MRVETWYYRTRSTDKSETVFNFNIPEDSSFRVVDYLFFTDGWRVTFWLKRLSPTNEIVYSHMAQVRLYFDGIR